MDSRMYPSRRFQISFSYHRGFTLVELAVVIGVMLALAAISIPTLSYMQHRGRVAATDAVVRTVAMKITEYPAKSWMIEVAGEMQVYPIFDVNRDGILDGTPSLENTILPSSASYSAVILASSYRGFFAMTHPVLPKSHVESSSMRVLDSWGQPLRIAFADAVYGSSGFGIWSMGPDGQTSASTVTVTDDIRSWEVGRGD
jgi:prepilin-type N-terminal cleavage/methylation domain-containing protein